VTRTPTVPEKQSTRAATKPVRRPAARVPEPAARGAGGALVIVSLPEIEVVISRLGVYYMAGQTRSQIDNLYRIIND